MIWHQVNKPGANLIYLAPTLTDSCYIKDINAQNIEAQILLRFFTSQRVKSWSKVSMFQQKIFLLCAVVVSVAMTANAECVDVDEGEYIY